MVSEQAWFASSATLLIPSFPFLLTFLKILLHNEYKQNTMDPTLDPTSLYYLLLDYESKINHKKHQIIDIIYYCNIKSSS